MVVQGKCWQDSLGMPPGAVAGMPPGAVVGMPPAVVGDMPLWGKHQRHQLEGRPYYLPLHCRKLKEESGFLFTITLTYTTLQQQ